MALRVKDGPTWFKGTLDEVKINCLFLGGFLKISRN